MMHYFLVLLVGLGLGIVVTASLVVFCFYYSDKCPKCGSRLKDGATEDREGKILDPVCGKCGNVWTPDWLKEARARGQ